jgi:hypothetical protein
VVTTLTLTGFVGVPVVDAAGVRVGRLSDLAARLVGHESALNDRVREAPLFYGTYAAVVLVVVGAVLVPTIPLVDILFLTQALNAILLLPCSRSSTASRVTPTSWASTRRGGGRRS